MKIQLSLIFTILVSVLVLALLVAGLSGESINFDAVQALMSEIRDSHYAIFIVVIIFVIASFLGAPQWALITACTVGFGPVIGGLFAWFSTLCSASVNFWLGRLLGQKRLTQMTGPRMENILKKVERNGVLWSFVVRLVPTGPFILVNLAAGVSSIRYVSFLLGTALGIIPKILIVAFIAQGMFAGLDGRIMSLVFIALAVVTIIITLSLQKRFRQRNPMA